MKRIACLGAVLAALTSGLPAVAADFPVKAPPQPIVVDNWTGFYIGLNGGYSFGRANSTLSTTDTTVGTITQTTLGGTVIATTTVPGATTTASLSDRAKMEGWLGGGQIGYNLKFNQWILGLEADAQATGQRGSSRFCITAGCPAGTLTASADTRLRWFGTFRGRAGWLVEPNLLLYVTGGLAVGEIGSDYAIGPSGGAALAVASAKTTRAGWVAGAGGEYRFSERWSAKLEYLYMDLGSVGASVSGSASTLPIIITVGDFRFVGVSTTTSTAAISTRVTDHILRAGLNYRF